VPAKRPEREIALLFDVFVLNQSIRRLLAGGLGDAPLRFFGRSDRTVPAAGSIENITALHKPNFHIQLATSGHALLLNQTGLTHDDDTPPALAPEVIGSISGWVKATIG